MLDTLDENLEYNLEDETLELEDNKTVFDSENAEKFWEAMTFISTQNQFFVERMKRIL
ncbi:hypothetical protein IKQ26_07630 [bacterium]|nr:hypothetical protein [bacterium]